MAAPVPPGPATPANSRLRVVVLAVLTYRRPDDLAVVLPLLRAQAAANPADDVRLLVVDNDPSGGARDQVTAVAGVDYVHEPRPGISAGRNRALDEALREGDADPAADVLVFIDDDERPSENWLSALLQTFDRYAPCAVVGPVVSSFDVEPEPWVKAGGFFDRRRLPTGSPVEVAATNNLLLDVAALRRAGIRFDERLGLSGGSDTLFSRRLVAAEGPMIWCDEAVVTDVVPPARITRDWVLRRQLRSGNSWSRTALMLSTSAVGRLSLRLRLTTMALARLLGGAVRCLLGVIGGDLGRQAGGAKAMARGLGMLGGAYGYAYSEYTRPGGS